MGAAEVGALEVAQDGEVNADDLAIRPEDWPARATRAGVGVVNELTACGVA